MHDISPIRAKSGTNQEGTSAHNRRVMIEALRLNGALSRADLARANRVAAGIQAGRVFVNGLYDAPEAPFGGFKQSGLGREFGVFGLDTYLEPKAIMGHDKRL